jgi:hypothetical protein
MPSAAFPPELQLLVFQFAVDKASRSFRALKKLSDFEPWPMPEPLDKEPHPLLLFPSLRTLTFQHMIPVSLFYDAIEHKRLETLHIGMPQHRHESPPTP